MRINLLLIAVSLALAPRAFTQPANPVTLQQCYQLAEQHYPLQAKTGLLDQAAQLRIDQVRAERMPQLTVGLQAHLQSEVMDFPFELPPPIGDPLDLPLYRLQGTVQANYLLYDGGLGKARIAQEEAGLEAEQQGVKVELNKLKETVNHYFFGILLLQEKSRILETTMENLKAQLQRLEAGIQNGVVLPSAADQLQVEILKLQAQIAETSLSETGLRQQLGEMTSQDPENLRRLELPVFPESAFPLPLKRPEFTWLELQQKSLLQRNEMLTAGRRPKVSAYASGGLGYPNPLNFFDESLAPFAQVGVQAQWTIYDWGKLKRDRELLDVQNQLIGNQALTLETNLNRADAAFLQQMESLGQLMEYDAQIVDLQAGLLHTISAQMENGVATVTDYVLQSNAETLARLQLKTHEVQLAQTMAGYWVHRGN